ncbi:HAD family hydrolase [Actinomyces oricola]|uniref:HAD family hydrolase n=1 Tax=Actinomyces oricola TaxID=206043 RepID=UPI000FFF00AA|nr:HAD family phosphatase [Actinomyces oricola]
MGLVDTPYVRAVLWDMDGTLMDSQPIWDESFQRRCEALGGTVTPDMVAAIKGASIRRTHEVIASTGATSGPDDPATAQVFATIAADVEASVKANPPLLPGAKEITSAMAEVGLAQVIVTQSPRPIVESVAHALGDVFVELVTGDDVASGKPTPVPYGTAIELLGLSPQECVAVEDSATGAASARSNDVYVIQIGGTKVFPGDPGITVVKNLAAVTPHLLLWAQR